MAGKRDQIQEDSDAKKEKHEQEANEEGTVTLLFLKISFLKTKSTMTIKCYKKTFIMFFYFRSTGHPMSSSGEEEKEQTDAEEK